jgi:hypothetical protein
VPLNRWDSLSKKGVAAKAADPGFDLLVMSEAFWQEGQANHQGTKAAEDARKMAFLKR